MKQVQFAKGGELIPSKQSSYASVSPANNRNAPEVIVMQTTLGTMDDHKLIPSRKTTDIEVGSLGNKLDMPKIHIDLQKMHTAAGG